MLIGCSAIHKIIGLPRSKNDRLTQSRSIRMDKRGG